MRIGAPKPPLEFRFPGLFLAGPEGFQLLSPGGSHIGHCVADFLSKNLWGLLGWYLRYLIYQHILK